MDAGARWIKLVLLRDGAVAARKKALCGIDLKEAAEELLRAALEEAGAAREEVSSILVTGSGGEAVPYATGKVSPVKAIARAAVNLVPSARTVADVGAEESRAVKCDESGNVLDFALNDKCAAGAGSFIEAMSRALEAKPEDLGPLSLTAEKGAAMNAQCVIFAESEVVSMIHRRIPPAEIARSVYEAMASRIATLLRRIQMSGDLALVGGVARDKGFVSALERNLGQKVAVPAEPEYAGALGAALCAP